MWREITFKKFIEYVTLWSSGSCCSMWRRRRRRRRQHNLIAAMEPRRSANSRVQVFIFKFLFYRIENAIRYISLAGVDTFQKRGKWEFSFRYVWRVAMNHILSVTRCERVLFTLERLYHLKAILRAHEMNARENILRDFSQRKRFGWRSASYRSAFIFLCKYKPKWIELVDKGAQTESTTCDRVLIRLHIYVCMWWCFEPVFRTIQDKY